MPKTKTAPANGAVGQNFTFGGGSAYADKDALVADGTPFNVIHIEFQTGKGFEGADRWSIVLRFADQRTQELTFGSNEKRDELLYAAAAHLDNGGTIENKRLAKYGNAYYIVD